MSRKYPTSDTALRGALWTRQTLWICTVFCVMGLTVVQGKCGVLKEGEDPKKVPESEWKARLGYDQYEIARQKGTERAFTGKFYDHHERGTYACSCCGAPLFSSDTKYESGSGWPSFYKAHRASGDPESASNVSRHTDISHGMMRTEVTCKQCSAHLGHVFPDGPKETGERFCINSASLDFDPADKNGES